MVKIFSENLSRKVRSELQTRTQSGFRGYVSNAVTMTVQKPTVLHNGLPRLNSEVLANTIGSLFTALTKVVSRKGASVVEKQGYKFAEALKENEGAGLDTGMVLAKKAVMLFVKFGEKVKEGTAKLIEENPLYRIDEISSKAKDNLSGLKAFAEKEVKDIHSGVEKIKEASTKLKKNLVTQKEKFASETKNNEFGLKKFVTPEVKEIQPSEKIKEIKRATLKAPQRTAQTVKENPIVKTPEVKKETDSLPKPKQREYKFINKEPVKKEAYAEKRITTETVKERTLRKESPKTAPKRTAQKKTSPNDRYITRAVSKGNTKPAEIKPELKPVKKQYVKPYKRNVIKNINKKASQSVKSAEIKTDKKVFKENIRLSRRRFKAAAKDNTAAKITNIKRAEKKQNLTKTERRGHLKSARIKKFRLAERTKSSAVKRADILSINSTKKRVDLKSFRDIAGEKEGAKTKKQYNSKGKLVKTVYDRGNGLIEVKDANSNISYYVRDGIAVRKSELQEHTKYMHRLVNAISGYNGTGDTQWLIRTYAEKCGMEKVNQSVIVDGKITRIIYKGFGYDITADGRVLSKKYSAGGSHVYHSDITQFLTNKKEVKPEEKILDSGKKSSAEKQNKHRA